MGITFLMAAWMIIGFVAGKLHECGSWNALIDAGIISKPTPPYHRYHLTTDYLIGEDAG